MKKALSIFGAILLLISLSACGDSKPGKTSDAMYQIGLNALQTADDYIEGKIAGDEAAERLHEYSEQANTQYKKDCEDAGKDTLAGTEFSNDYSINHSISMLQFSISSSSMGGAAMSEVREKCDGLAECLGK